MDLTILIPCTQPDGHERGIMDWQLQGIHMNKMLVVIETKQYYGTYERMSREHGIAADVACSCQASASMPIIYGHAP